MGQYSFRGAQVSTLPMEDGAMGFNRRKMEDQRRQLAEREAAARRALNPQIRANAERLVAG